MDLKWCQLRVSIIVSLASLTIANGFSCEPKAPTQECSPGMETWGYTEPAGDIAIEYGNPLDIKCVLHEKYRTTDASRRMVFTRNNATLSPEFIEIVNNYTIRLRVDKPPKVLSDNYGCKYVDEKNNSHVICMNLVSVGTKPEPVTDFECIGRNYDNLTCTWTPPQNYIKTKYNLIYTLPGRAARYTMNKCPELTLPTEDNPKMSCFYNISTNPQYRQAHNDFNFTLTMENCFGKLEMVELFKHFQHVLSGPPENLNKIGITPSSIDLSWEVPYSMLTFPPGLHHRVMYQCEYMDKVWRTIEILDKKREPKVFFNLTGLPYAHALCDIRVSIRSAAALPDDESMWSQNTSRTIRTGMKIPNKPPDTNIGSFQQLSIGSNMQIREGYIYWKQINDWEKGGPDFRYVVKVVEDEDLKPIEVTNAYARFINLSISKSYTFHVWSSNSNGTSLDWSSVFLPKQNNKIGDPISFIKVDFNGGVYELSWKPPKLLAGQQIENYTIFWCSNERERPHQCTGHLSWEVLPSTVRVRNVTLNDTKQIYQFAISANSRSSSSGMLWSDCTVLHDKSMGKMKNVWINRVYANSIELGWKLDCTDRVGSVQGFIVYYCPTLSPTESICKEAQRNVTFKGDTTVERGVVQNLTPYTTYMLSVAVISKQTTHSQQSDYLYNTTSETAPSTPPLNIQYLDVSNTSITLSWQAPNATNGVLKYYEVVYSNPSGTSKVDKVTPSLKNLTIANYELKDLNSYENYTIQVRACTTHCSNYSVPLYLHTKIGYPGKISTPTVRYQNDTIMRIGWDRPIPPGGRIDHYDVEIKQKHDDGNKTINFTHSTTEYDLINCGDNGRYNTFYVTVRGVNVLEDGSSLEGTWSDELQAYCRPPTNLKWYFIIPATILTLLFFVYCYYKCYRRCKDMKDVQVKLPPGLAPAVSDHTLVPWNSTADKRLEERDTHSPPDQELLLDKLTGDGRHLMSRDSSGCSSGHESATSSISSAAGRISSSSDSGTDQAAASFCMSRATEHDANAVVARESPYAVVGAPPAATTAASPQPPPALVVPQGLMVKTANPGYISIDSQRPTPGYVVTGVKNNGYVRRDPIEPTRNTGYVVAGAKNCKLD